MPESGRAGRDGKAADSIIILSAAWQPQLNRQPGTDEEAMQLYLTQQYCSRGNLNQFLDERPCWKWCMKGEDERCGVCTEHHTERRPSDPKLHLPRPTVIAVEGNIESDRGQTSMAGEMVFTGPSELLQVKVCDGELSQYERNLETMMGCCLYCHVEANHSSTQLPHVHDATSGFEQRLKHCRSVKD
ncbi:hypothetical protein FOPG_18570 [Fusarium oxysporum f. sp. conglutinans race 2 54008]|uniref:Helicase C-terminal domain-containing protein n=1 Tax=Fusarium oxysporum f. sp. conglutinans race 2 54008 TaxID=1089457 RepID=X0GPF4_FUSOX|nr:hypothetical protein FOPG_18570 [Fusarium oxysporum f. sp. conglutinans race 2 54008]